MRVPLFKERPSLRPPSSPSRRVLVILPPTKADVRSVRALWRRLRPHGVALLAASECHGEVQAERGAPLAPNLLLIDAATQTWDAVVVAGGRGARDVAEDQLARAIVAHAEHVAAIGAGRDVLARAGVAGFVSRDDTDVADWLGRTLGIGPIDRRGRVPKVRFHWWRASMRCEQIMKRTVECVTAKDSVQVAARKMRDQNVGFLPVCENGTKVIGTITDRDIAVRACADDRAASQTKIGDVMTKEVIACRPSDDIARAQELMSKHHKSRMLCIDDGGKLVGVISLSDIAQHQPDAGAETLREVTTREAHA